MNIGRTRDRLERNWRFLKGGAKGAQTVDFDDSKWRKLDLPHDWSIEGPFDEKDPGGALGGYLPGGRAWYRKTFRLPAADAGKRVVIEFDGVYMNAGVWINGHKLGVHHYGYTSFHFDLTPYVRFGKEQNVLAVSVDNSRRPNTRWYSGSGIYRHVWLTVTDKIHVAHWGIAVSTVKATKASATVEIETTMKNDTDAGGTVELTTDIVDPDGKVVATATDAKTVRAGTRGTFVQQLRVSKPALWDVDSPSLYKAVTRVNVDGEVRDDTETPFGIRTARLDARRGFILNGKPLKLKGVNLHHDNGCLGAVVYDRAEERRVELMKSIGANAIRASHNPPSPEFLDACDRLGVVVIDEAFDEWEWHKLKYGYENYFRKFWRDDITRMVMRDRNHPSVFIWSIGNEVWEQHTPQGERITAAMAPFVRRLDPTRPVGYGSHPARWSPKFWDPIDACGYNYRDELYAPLHEQYPLRILFGSETLPLHAFRTWNRAVENKHVLGEFIWTGMDYIGEATIGHARDAHTRFPTNLALCGELDLCGFKKPRSYYRDILWDNGTDLYIAVRRPLEIGEPFKLSPWGWPDSAHSWTWPQSLRTDWDKPVHGDLQVDVYSACDKVELKLNGKTIGVNTTSRASRYMAFWMVSYEPGTLEAIGYIKDKPVARQVLRTAGDPAALALTPDRSRIAADGYDLSFVTVEVRDDTGMRHPNADNEVTFSVKGPGKIVGVSNGNPASIESFQGRTRKAYNGRCQVVVKSTTKPGAITLTARSMGLTAAVTTIESEGGCNA